MVGRDVGAISRIAVHAHADHLLIELQSYRGEHADAAYGRDLSVVLKAFADTVGQLAAIAD